MFKPALILAALGGLSLISAVVYTTIKPAYKREECTVQIFGTKGALYERAKRECQTIRVKDAKSNLIETIQH